LPNDNLCFPGDNNYFYDLFTATQRNFIAGVNLTLGYNSHEAGHAVQNILFHTYISPETPQLMRTDPSYPFFQVSSSQTIFTENNFSLGFGYTAGNISCYTRGGSIYPANTWS
jgi:hypothetical protein